MTRQRIFLSALLIALVGGASVNAQDGGGMQILGYISSGDIIPIYDGNGAIKGNAKVADLPTPTKVLDVRKDGKLYRIDFGGGDTWVRSITVEVDQTAKVGDAECRIAEQGKADDRNSFTGRGLGNSQCN